LVVTLTRLAAISAVAAITTIAWPSPQLYGMSVTAAVPADGPTFEAGVPPPALERDFQQKSFKRDVHSGNYLSPKVSSKTFNEKLVPVQIDGKYARDLRGNPIFLRESIRNKLIAADAAMFAAKKQHIKVNYGFRANVLQAELFKQLSGKGAVAPAGSSFHETGMALDIQNWHEAQRFMIEAGFVGGCYGIEEDYVHYSINELTKSSDATAFRRCTLKEIPEHILKGLKLVGGKATSFLPFGRKKKS
jgi:hypothetical protein